MLRARKYIAGHVYSLLRKMALNSGLVNKCICHCDVVMWSFADLLFEGSNAYDTIRDAILTCARKPT